MGPPPRRESILETARRAFTTNGYDGTAIGGLAKDLGISKAAITYHFPAKADFLSALLDPLLHDLEAVIDSTEEQVEWPDGARDLLTRYLDVLLDFADLARWVDTDPALKFDKGPGEQLRALDQQLAARITDSDDIATRLLGLAVVGGLWRPLHHESPDAIRDHQEATVDAALASYAPVQPH